MTEAPRRRLLKGLPGPPVHTPLAWYKAQQQHAAVGNADNWGWMISQGTEGARGSAVRCLTTGEKSAVPKTLLRTRNLRSLMGCPVVT